jgi:hypothetical protein
MTGAVIARSVSDEAIYAAGAEPWIASPSARNDGGANMARAPCVYIMANKRNGTLYTGVTSNLAERAR